MKKFFLLTMRSLFNYCSANLENKIIKTINQIEYNLRYEAKKLQLINHVLNDTSSGVTSKRYANHDIIVSLTSFGKRINDVAFTIESIMQQSMKANKIILWLDESFLTTALPESLINQQKRGLEIKFTHDILAYKKIIPQLLYTPNDAIITIDDDVLYEYDILEHLIKEYLKSPDMIHCCRARKIELGQNGKLLPYNQWKLQTNIGCDRLNFLTGVGGVLYPPNSLDPDVLKEDIFTKLCKYNDDIWLVAMALKKGTLINKVYTRDKYGDDYLLNCSVQDVGLFHTNVEKNANDRQLEAVFTKYSLYDKLK